MRYLRNSPAKLAGSWRRAGVALLVAGALLVLAGCGGTPTGHPIVSKPGTPRAGLTPLAVGTPATAEPPIGTLPPRADPDATVTPGSDDPTPDASLYARLIYTYTVGIRPIKLVLDIQPDGTTKAYFAGQSRAGTLSAERMAAISAGMRSANFFALQDAYIPARTCCDLPGHELTVFTVGGRSKTVEILGPAPDALAPLIDALGGIWRDLPAAG